MSEKSEKWIDDRVEKYTEILNDYEIRFSGIVNWAKTHTVKEFISEWDSFCMWPKPTIAEYCDIRECLRFILPIKEKRLDLLKVSTDDRPTVHDIPDSVAAGMMGHMIPEKYKDYCLCIDFKDPIFSTEMGLLGEYIGNLYVINFWNYLKRLCLYTDQELQEGEDICKKWLDLFYDVSALKVFCHSIFPTFLYTTGITGDTYYKSSPNCFIQWGQDLRESIDLLDEGKYTIGTTKDILNKLSVFVKHIDAKDTLCVRPNGKILVVNIKNGKLSSWVQ